MSHDDTLQDLKDRDVDNLEDLLKKGCVSLVGTSTWSVHTQVMLKLRDLLLKFGIDLDKHAFNIQENMASDKFNDAMISKGLKVEFRQYRTLADVWRSGLYVYKDNEIIGFFQLVGDTAMSIMTRQGPVFSAKFYSRVKLED